ncbi:hypothetical protein RJ527_04645 [Thalassospiraceae bacterium LMO-SO8]|nr:hypothetical protein [Alphaproteobacteria bacterium LMO-S08]WND77038.1 hypothetical protein RJ527_04645 [Thalassospiraceae bacterium LMO-SO8]
MTEPARSELTSFELFGPEPRERLHRIWSSCWIDYPIALQALKRLDPHFPSNTLISLSCS